MALPDQPFDGLGTGQPDLEMEKSVAKLQSLLVLVILSGLILTGSFFVFLLREVTLIRRQVMEQAQYIGEFDKSMDDMKSQFQAFARTNPDFNQILIRYFGTNAVIQPRQGK